MVETTAQIEDLIDDRRARLGFSLDELEDRVREATDWRQQFSRRPLAWLSVAVAGGAIVGSVSNGRRRRRAVVLPASGARANDGGSELRRDMMAALLGLAASTVTKAIGGALRNVASSSRPLSLPARPRARG